VDGVTMDAQWRQVVGLEGLYEVSDTGTVATLRRGRRAIRKVHVDTCGYFRITFKIGETTINRRVHTLVAEAFIGPRPDGMVVRHLNGNHLDNRSANLRYGTVAENAQDMLRHGRQRNARKTRCDNGHPFTPENTRTEGSARKCRRCHADREYARRARERNAA
jgi:hypothetical protein